MLHVSEDIISLPIEMSSKLADSKFRLVHIASQRVRELSDGAPLLVSTRSIKDTTIALEESLLGRFKLIIGEEAKKAKEERRKQEERMRMEEQLSAKEEEIRKELSAYLSESQTEEGAEGAEEPEETTEAEESEEEGVAEESGETETQEE